MLLADTEIEGVTIVQSELNKDNRGFFSRIFCLRELEGLLPAVCQINHSMTRKKGTVRGMHFQYPPHGEVKMVRCIKGVIFDVAVDLRRGSPTFLQWHGEVLSAEAMNALVIPVGCAHGFQALQDDVEMIYIHSNYYCREGEGAIRFDDLTLSITWPSAVTEISQKDLDSNFISGGFSGIEV